MASYNIPRNNSGEGRILYIFSMRAILYTFVGAAIGGIIYYILNFIGLGIIGIIIGGILAFIGFAIATFKIPNIRTIKVTESVGGEKIDEILKRYIKFRSKKTNKYTLFTKEENKNGE